MPDFLDRLRRTAELRGRVTVLAQVSTRQRDTNPRISEALASGVALSMVDLTDTDTGQPLFVFGATPMTDPYIVS